MRPLQRFGRAILSSLPAKGTKTRYSVRCVAGCSASPATAWRLMASPELWARWAPHVRGGRGLGDPEVRAGARGAAMLLGVLPVHARILDKEAGRSWSWLVGPLTIEHRVEPADEGCEIVFEATAARNLRAVPALYAPVMRLMAARLARTAEEDEAQR